MPLLFDPNPNKWTCSQAEFCLGFLITFMLTLKLIVIETGIASVHSIMTFDRRLPRGIQYLTALVAVLGCISLYFVAASAYEMDLILVWVLFFLFVMVLSGAMLVVALSLPLGAVAKGTYQPELELAVKNRRLGPVDDIELI